MPNENTLSTLFDWAYSISYRPSHKSVHMDVPNLNAENFSQFNAVIKPTSPESEPVLHIHIISEKWVSLSVTFGSENIHIEKLRPMYDLKRKLLESIPELVELCLFNDRILGMYIGTKFKLKLS